jgi:riboflavin biosynthesis pyrimidine reductase
MTSSLVPDGPLELLFEQEGLPSADLGAALLEAYGGGRLGFDEPALIANFVSSVDGVVALPSGGESGMVISQNSAPDHFVMGLLRALADVVVVGAGTLRRSPGHRWIPDAIFRPAALEYARLRSRLGLAEQPRFVVVSASGAIDTSQPALENAIIATTRSGQSQLERRAPASSRVVAFQGEAVDWRELLRLLRAEGARLVLTEGGPRAFGELVSLGVVDELFLTSSPALFGRFSGDERKALTEGFDLGRTDLRLRSVRRHGSHLFLRYGLPRGEVAGVRG